MVEAFAPGKLLLTGEYAVLGGAPAVTVALGGPAAASVRDSAHWGLETSAAGGSWTFDLEMPARVVWHGSPPSEVVDLPAAVLAEVLRHWPGELLAGPRELRLDTTAFVHQVAGKPVKLGLGSSAALVAALAGALLAACGIAAEATALRSLCLAAHRQFQGGRGSGVDVLTAIHGGLLICTPQTGDLQAEPLQWPSALHLVVAWTGQSASTPALISRYDEFRAQRPSVFEQHAARLRAAAEAAANAWRAGAVAGVLDSVTNYAAALRAIDGAGDIGIWTAAHDRFADLAAAAGAVYKTSGAGGGDLGYALTDSMDVADTYREAVAAAGGRVLELSPGLRGLRVTGS